LKFANTIPSNSNGKVNWNDTTTWKGKLKNDQN